MREIRILSELKSDLIVEYFDSWIESLVEFNEIRKYLFIKMELCEQNLTNNIQIMRFCFEEKFKIIYFFISCQLFRELTKYVNYLHSKNIIHRDLKPENVLISDGRNGVFLKLCDFNISKALGIEDEQEMVSENYLEEFEDEPCNHSRNVGTPYYIAPEIKTGIYNKKSDMFGLALIATEIFSFEDSVGKIRRKLKLKL